MAQLFISYAREDTDFVRRIYDKLVELGRDAWVDWEDIPLTADWLAEAYAGIEGADAFIFIISPASVRSGPCTLELEHALQNNKRLIPLLRREVVEPDDLKVMHPSLSAHNWLKSREEDDFDQAFESIITALDTDLHYVKAHTRYIIRAAEWDTKGHDKSLLLRGTDLTEAETWLQENESKQPKATDLQRDYIRASRAEATQRQRLYLLSAIVVMVIAGLALFAWVQRNSAVLNEAIAVAANATAQYNAEQADSFALAASAQQSLYQDGNTDLAIVLALEADRIPNPPPLARSILAQAVYAPGTRERLDGYALYPDADLAFTPDGKSILAVKEDESLALSDYATQTVQQSWTLEDRVWTINIAPDVPDGTSGNLALLTLANGQLVLIDLETGGQRTLFPERGSAIAAVFAPDGKHAFAGLEDGSVIQWDVETSELTNEYVTDETDMWTIAVSPDGDILAAGFDNGSIILWDIVSTDLVATITGHTSAASSLAFRSDGSQLLSGSEDQSVRLWDVSTGTEIQRLIGHKDRIRRVTFGLDGKTAFSGSYDTHVIQWNLENGQQIQRFVGHLAAVYNVIPLPDNQMLTGSSDGTLRLWDTINGAQVKQFDGHEDIVYSVKITPDGTKALSGSRDGSLILWDIETGRVIRRMVGHESAVIGVAISPDGTQALSGAGDSLMMLWDLNTGEQIRVFTGHESSVYSVAFSPDGRTALSGSVDETAILWDIETGSMIRQFSGHDDRVRSVAFSPDGREALTSSSDKLLILWDVESGDIIRRFEGHQSAVYDAQFSPDGRYALSGSLDLTMILWDVETGQIVRQFAGHTGDVFSVGFSSDGRTAISGSFDGTVRVWSVNEGQELLRFDAHHSGVRSVAFSPDAQTFISASEDYSLRQWRIESFDEVTLWTYANRYIVNLSCEQREFYRLDTRCANGIAPTRTPYLTSVPTFTPTPLPTSESTAETAPVEPSTTPTLTPIAEETAAP